MIYHSMSAPRWRCAEVLVLLCFSGCFVGPTAPMDAAVPIIVHPTRDQYVPYNSIKNVTFSCAVESGRSAIWKVLGTQVRLQQQRETFASSGVFIYGESNNSIISVSLEARRVFRNLSLLCLSDQGLISTEGMTYSVVSFDEPEAPADLTLRLSDGEPVLEWDRSRNVPTAVEITYMVTINSSASGIVVYENTTSSPTLPLGFLEDEVVDRGGCEMFEFTVQATNDAGHGPISEPIVDTIPLSPDVTNISRHLTVKEVDLQPLRVTISFPPVMPCSANFTLRNYSVNIGDDLASTVTSEPLLDDDGNILLQLTDNNLPVGVTFDDSFNLTVTACSDITCRTSKSVVFNTTDVQLGEAIFFGNNLYLRCTFAVNSAAQGCLFRLSISDSNGTDEFEVSREPGYSCIMITKVYDDVTVSDLEENGVVGNISLTVMKKAVTMDEFMQQTQCVIGGGISDAIVAGATAGALGLVLLIVIPIICICIAVWLVTRRKLKFGSTYSVQPSQQKETPPPMGMVQSGPPPPPSSNQEMNRIQDDHGGNDLLLKDYVTAKMDEGIISIKLNELIKDILPNNNTSYSRLKVKFE